MKRLIGGATLAMCLIGAGSVLADPRLDEKVYAPYVQKGVFEVEGRIAGETGRGDLSGKTVAVWELEYGVSDHLSLSLVGALTHSPGGATRTTAIGIEAVDYLGQIPKLGIDTGLYLEYARGLNGENDKIEAKILLAKNAGRFQGLLNLIVEKPLSAPTGEGIGSYGYAASATWRVLGHLRLGAEAFGDFGDDHAFLGHQGAYVGPQLKWSGKPKGSPVEIDVDAGWLAAVGTDRAEARSQVRLGVELERRF